MNINIKKINRNNIIVGIILLVVLYFIITNIKNIKNIKNVNSLYQTNTSGEKKLNDTSYDDTKLVENYIKENFARLVPERAVLGGTWYLVKINVNTTTKTGTFTYEDGHKQGMAAFRFTKSSDGLLSLGITKLN